MTAELNKSAKYLDWLRDRIRRGLYKVSAPFRRQLGILDEDGAELAPRVGSGPALAYKSLAAEGRRMPAMPIDRDSGLPDVGATEARVKEVSARAAKRYAETGDYATAMAELLARLERTRPRPI